MWTRNTLIYIINQCLWGCIIWKHLFFWSTCDALYKSTLKVLKPLAWLQYKNRRMRFIQLYANQGNTNSLKETITCPISIVPCLSNWWQQHRWRLRREWLPSRHWPPSQCLKLGDHVGPHLLITFFFFLIFKPSRPPASILVTSHNAPQLHKVAMPARPCEVKHSALEAPPVGWAANITASTSEQWSGAGSVRGRKSDRRWFVGYVVGGEGNAGAELPLEGYWSGPLEGLIHRHGFTTPLDPSHLLISKAKPKGSDTRRDWRYVHGVHGTKQEQLLLIWCDLTCAYFGDFLTKFLWCFCFLFECIWAVVFSLIVLSKLTLSGS